MFKKVVKTIAGAFASGLFCAGGTWAWKNYVEPKLDEMNKKAEEEKKKEQPAN
jgi:hypothetical protein